MVKRHYWVAFDDAGKAIVYWKQDASVDESVLVKFTASAEASTLTVSQ
jgi:hypothetical protein